MQIRPINDSLRAALLSQASLGGDDVAVDTAVNQLVEALGPALHIAAMEIAEQAAAEVRAQLPDHSVDVVLSDGDPSLRIGELPSTADAKTTAEDLDARITLRLAPSLKMLVEDAAQTAGDSVNAWVVDSLAKRARRQRGGSTTYDHSFDM